MATYFGRSAWTSQGAVRPLTPLDAGEVLGVAVHWPGSATSLGQTATLQETAARLEGWRKFHTRPEPKGRGWSDIAYQVAIDQAGRVFELRGIRWRSAANGDQPRNRAWGAVLLVVGAGDVPSPEMLAAFSAWRHQAWLRAYPSAVRVVGHGDIYESDCPGGPVRDLIRSGRLAGPSGGGAAMPDKVGLTSDAVEAVAEAVTGAGALHPVRVADGQGEFLLPGSGPGRDVVTPATAWSRTLDLLVQQAALIDDLSRAVAALRDEQATRLNDLTGDVAALAAVVAALAADVRQGTCRTDQH